MMPNSTRSDAHSCNGYRHDTSGAFSLKSGYAGPSCLIDRLDEISQCLHHIQVQIPKHSHQESFRVRD